MDPGFGARPWQHLVLALLFLALTLPGGPIPASEAVAGGVIRFAPETRYSVADPPTAVELTGLAGDAPVDLLVSGVGWAAGFVGRSNGTFLPQPAVHPGGNVAVAAANFDAGFNRDLVVVIPAIEYLDCHCECHPGCGCTEGDCCCRNCHDVCTAVVVPGYLRVFLGNGLGGFFPNGDAINAGAHPADVAIGDFDQDGHLDLAVTSSEHVSTFLGKGDGTFESEHKIANDGDLGLLSVADLDGDGVEDLVASSRVGDQVAVLLGTGRGGFGNPVRLASGDGPGEVRIGDLNGDDHADLVVPNTASGDISVLLGNGDGTFTPQLRIVVGPSPTDITLTDFDRDGHLDLAVTSVGENDIWILAGSGDGTFGMAQRLAVGQGPVSIVSGDFDLDGWPDLAVANRDARSVSVLLNQTGQPDCVLLPQVCDDGNLCTDDICDLTAGCLHQSNTFPCDDGKACTFGDRCLAGTCRATGISDADGDGRTDALCGGNDCNDSDPASWSLPLEVATLLVSTATPASLSWENQGAVAGPGTVYNLISGSMQIGAGLSTDGVCLQSASNNSFSDDRGDPPSGLGFWYLVRARNSCGTGTFGNPFWDTLPFPCP